MSQYQIYSSPNLLSYLSKNLHDRWCSIIQEDTTYYLYSSDIDYLCSSDNKRSKRRFDGLLSVLDLLSLDLKVQPYDENVCVEGLLFILNGIIKLKYNESNGLTRYLLNSSSNIIASGIIKREQNTKEVQKDISGLLKLQPHPIELQNADKKPPTMLKTRRIARRNPPVVRALYHYANQENTVNLRKVIEEIMADTHGKGKAIKFDEWNKNKWPEPEISASKMEAILRWLHNRYLSNDKSFHSIPHHFLKFSKRI